MPRKLTSASSLERLKGEAKRWLKALRANNVEARERFVRAHPTAPTEPTLRHVQHALASMLGFDGWSALTARADARDEDGPVAQTAEQALVERVLDNACPDHHVRGKSAHIRAERTAMRLLARTPDIAHASFATRVVCGDLAGVTRMLAEQPARAGISDGEAGSNRTGAGDSDDLLQRDLGPKGWRPLLYLCFTRLPLPDVTDNAVDIARALLDAGADPTVFFMAGDSQYTPLVGAIGEGEEDRPPHPRRDQLVRLLLERGANPYDIQVVYNIGFHGRVLWFLELIYEHSVSRGRAADWADPEWTMLDMGGYGSGARWHLNIAVRDNDRSLAEWCLAHGAGANAAPARGRGQSHESLYGCAVRLGHLEVAELLLRHGAKPETVVLSPLEVLVAACKRGDLDAIRASMRAHSELLTTPHPLHAAARADRSDVIECLLELGASPDVADASGKHALHIAASAGALRAARTLVDRSAAIDPVERDWNNTPLGAAVYNRQSATIDLLSVYSRDIWELVFVGKFERVRDLLTESPELARIQSNGQTPLMWLAPEDETRAIAMARLLIEHGADPSVRNADGMTAADRADRMGMYDLAAMLRWHTGSRL